MPPELINVLVQIGVAGAFIWYLREELAKRDTLITGLYERAELVRQEERAKCDQRCSGYEERLKVLREDRDNQLRERIADKAQQEQLLWQIGESLRHLAESERRRQREQGRDDTDDKRLGSGAGR